MSRKKLKIFNDFYNFNLTKENYMI